MARRKQAGPAGPTTKPAKKAPAKTKTAATSGSAKPRPKTGAGDAKRARPAGPATKPATKAPAKPATKAKAKLKQTWPRPDPIAIEAKMRIAARIREIRLELFGEHGGPTLASRLNLPARTWYNYETGVTVPAEVLLAFVEATGANPLWVLTGKGPKYRRGDDEP